MTNIADIKSPADIKGLDLTALADVAEQLRCALVKKLGAHGGHVGPNLGVVEATVALHYVFNAPEDKIIFDVSHQSYVHKMLTGRIASFLDPAKYDDVTGFTCPRESNYDLFEIGHTSTSIALAAGMAKARDLAGGKENMIAFIGDASLGGGEALEALDFAPTLNSNFIVVVNDNQMSIAENHGALYDHLAQLRESNGTSPNNIFKALGYQYIYVAQGNDLHSLIEAFKAVRNTDHAVVVHINTMKGEGLPVAEANKEKFHFCAPFDLKTGAPLSPAPADTYQDIFARTMLQAMQANPNVVTITAGTPGAIGFGPERREAAGKQFIDAGICEQAATAIAAGLAKGESRPVFGVCGTFIQRAYDQLSHDIAINNLPAVVVDFYGGAFGMNDVTHLGFFDIAMVSNIPNIVFLSPVNAQEYTAMLQWAIGQREHPVFLRTPGGAVVNTDRPVNTDFFSYDVVSQGNDVAIIAEGAFFQTGEKAAALMRQRGLNPTLINPRILSQLDTACLDTLKDYSTVITLEDGIVDGGFGQKVAAYLGSSKPQVKVLGLKKEFLDRYHASQLLKDNGLTPEQIAALV
ncbi:MAG: 1-deoxy-D-xylulose-5-phosphate synthase [Firmicutes bacterium]|nr:1-deoxy-D-xylulose-5-phosphate synthase [Bacillota bacterium]MCM1401509.1 1-deoxy-D-xylulose-5-phosphate synthase [Bacteroides sp.]MCM1477359.1 1-deoxy-D-xylulose-5-phosphate synthase [Bacteroides sp.]